MPPQHNLIVRQQTLILGALPVGPFAAVYVHAGVAWPSGEQAVPYDGDSIRLIPPRFHTESSASTYPIAVFDAVDRDKARAGLARVRRFLSAVAWREQTFLREIDNGVGSWAMHFSTRMSNAPTTDHFETTDLVVPATPEARLAMAFYRDGLSLQHTAFRFLSYFKILNVPFGPGKQQTDWISRNLQHVSGPRSLERIADLSKSEPDVGSYLYQSGRCAVAHAFSSPLIDPDNPEDELRLALDMPLMRELVARLMQTELGIPAPPKPTAT